MGVSEKVMYLRGLMAGLEVDETTKEGKVYHAITDALNEIALSISELEEAYNELSEQVEAIDEDLSNIESDIYEDDALFDDDFEDDFDIYECPACGNRIYIEDALISEGSMMCPSCGETITFELEDDEDDGTQEN